MNHSEEFFKKGGVGCTNVGHYTIALYWEPAYSSEDRNITLAYTVDVNYGMDHIQSRKRFTDLFEAMTYVAVVERELIIKTAADLLIGGSSE